MNLDIVRGKLPEYAKDLRLNLSTALAQPALSEQQTWGAALASAWAVANSELLQAVAEEARVRLSPAAFEAAQGAAAIMGMNNVYYRFLHLSSNESYRTMRAGLRMNVIRSHGVEPADFELWCLAVSAIHGCGACVDSHEKVVRQKGLSEEAVLSAVRIAAVVHAVARALDAETALNVSHAPAVASA